MRESVIILSQFLLVKNEVYSSVHIQEKFSLFPPDCFCCLTFSNKLPISSLLIFALYGLFPVNRTGKGTRNWTGPMGPNVRTEMFTLV